MERRFFINRKWISLLGFLVLWLLIGAAGSWATSHSVQTWYPSLAKPAWTPPAWVFGPAWTVLYILIAFAGWMIFLSRRTNERQTALRLYWAQALLNFLWSFLFFYLRSPLLGLLDISLLASLIALVIHFAWKCNRTAALLLIPYLLWVLYAWTLNGGIWALN